MGELAWEKGKKKKKKKEKVTTVQVAEKANDGTAQTVIGQTVENTVVESDDCPPAYLEREEFNDERKWLLEAELKSADQHDKAMLTLTAGALALSITFMEKIAPKPLPYTLSFLGWSWFVLILSLVAILASFLTSQYACQRSREILDEKQIAADHSTVSEKNKWGEWTHFLTIASYVLFIIGICLMALFSLHNFPTGAPK